MGGQLQIQLTASAETEYAHFCDEAERCISKGEDCNPKVKLFRMLEEALSKTIPSDPFNQKMALAGPLSSIFRYSCGDLRICYLGQGQESRIIVLYICQADGEESDSYATFAYMVMSGKFDAAFASLGLKPPDRQGVFPNPSIN